MLQLAALLVLFVAAILEICGDVGIGRGIQNKSYVLAIGGAGLLVMYGAVVNIYNVLIGKTSPEGGRAEWNFTQMLGVYIACFAVTNVLIDLIQRKPVPRATALGTVIIAIGGIVVQWGSRYVR